MSDIFNDQRLKTELTINSVAPSISNKSASGKTLRRFTGIQWYESKITVNYTGEDQYLFDEWLAEHRYGKPFTFPMYKSINMQYRGKQTSLCNVSAVVPAGAREIPVSILLETGTKFTFANHTKVYEVTDTDPVTKTILIFPNMRESVQAGELINYRTPVLTLKIDSNDFEQNLKQTTLSEFDAIEAL